jgi:hypothetical protein
MTDGIGTDRAQRRVILDSEGNFCEIEGRQQAKRLHVLTAAALVQARFEQAP